MVQRFICGLKLNKITPTNYYDTTNLDDSIDFHDINIIYDRPNLFTIFKNRMKKQKIAKHNKVQQRTTKDNKGQRRTRQNNKRKKWTFLLKFINCLKC
jgi:hypothetical protein